MSPKKSKKETKKAGKKAEAAKAKKKSERKDGDYYAPILPFHTGFLEVGNGHKIYFEQSGNPQGKPVVFLHGGPGGGSSPLYRQFFDPEIYHIVIFDQRGCGQSTPFASLEHNTTWDLVSDIEALRSELGIGKWMIFGGSWGSTLALAYAEAHPERVTEMVLRGIFMGRKHELDWFYQKGASFVFPEYWREYWEHIPPMERDDMVRAYNRRLTSSDPSIRLAAAKIWSAWEGCSSKLFIDKDLIARNSGDEFATAFARIECHYFVNGCFFRSDSQLLDDVERIRHIPCVMVQGRYDMVCPATSAFDLHAAYPEAQLIVVPDAGHSMGEPGIKRALIEATDKFGQQWRQENKKTATAGEGKKSKKKK